MTNDTTFVKKRAPTLYAIIIIKLLKGLGFLLLAFGAYRMSDENLPELFRQMLLFFHLDPEKKFFADLTARIELVTQARMVWLAGGTFIYSLFSLVEGTGLLFRVSWAGWLAIGESAFFVPIEVLDLIHKYSVAVSVILVINVAIVWYLLQNRHRLFRHHHQHQ